MSKWLKIKEGSFINLDSIDRWWYENDKIYIYYANGRFLTIGVRHADIKVKESDIDRIIKELKEYMDL
jgi:hypothetical protein